MFINLSNHPSDKWDENQRKEALKYGEIVDIMFPYVDPEADEAHVVQAAEKIMSRILQTENIEAVMVQGEYTLTYEIVKRLQGESIKALCSCTRRDTTEFTDESGNLIKQSVFRFVKFREYT